MSEDCKKIHELFNSAKRFYFPFNEKEIPQNGIYVLFEKNEKAHNADRIVRIGTHTGKNQLPSRLKQHFINENKDRSIFRKNIGRALLNQKKDSFLQNWEIDLTTKQNKQKYAKTINFEKQKETEKQVTKHLQENLSFTVIKINDKEKRLELESQLISTISLCEECQPSKNWLGNYSPKQKIKESGLWIINELYKKPLTKENYEYLKTIKDHEKDQV